MVGLTDDLIARYLAELKAGLRTTPERAGQILAEAEDHLRASAAAGQAMGITERDAQEAAIAAFGGARAVARAHRRPVAALAEAGVAAMKLGAVYLLTVSAIGWSTVLLEKMVRRIPVSPGTQIVLAPVGYARTIEVLTVLAAIGLALLAGYRHAGRSAAQRCPDAARRLLPAGGDGLHAHRGTARDTAAAHRPSSRRDSCLGSGRARRGDLRRGGGGHRLRHPDGADPAAPA